MCLILYRPKAALDKQFPEDMNTASLYRNNDGVGVMYPVKYANNKRKLIVDKMVGTKEEMTAFLKKHWEESAKLKAPLAVHYRFKTHGDINVDNAHPHRVTDTLYLMHNGVITNTCPSTSDSDTRMFIASELGMLAEAYGDTVVSNAAMKKLIERRIGGNNKLIMMDEQGHITLFNEDSGTWRDGLWLSNTYSVAPIPTATPTYNGYNNNYNRNYFDDDDGYPHRGYPNNGVSRFPSTAQQQKTLSQRTEETTQAEKSMGIISSKTSIKELVKCVTTIPTATALSGNQFYCYQITYKGEGMKEAQQVWFYPNLNIIKDDEGNVLRDFKNDSKQATQHQEGAASKEQLAKDVASTFRTNANDAEELDYVSEYVEEIAERLKTGTAEQVEEIVTTEIPSIVADAVLSIIHGTVMTPRSRVHSTAQWGS